MKRLSITLLLLAFLCQGVFAQIFNTGKTLKQGQFSIGIEPAVLINGGTNLMVFVHGGAGITSGIDFGVTFGAFDGNNYFGADVEFALGKRASFAAGAHHFGGFALDGTFLIDIPIARGVVMYTGGDVSIYFNNDNISIPLWLPVGLEIPIKKSMSFMFEAQVGITDPAYHLIGGGLVFYL